MGRAAELARDGQLLLGHGEQQPRQPRSAEPGLPGIAGGVGPASSDPSPRARTGWQLLWPPARSSERCHTWRRRPSMSGWPWVSPGPGGERPTRCGGPRGPRGPVGSSQGEVGPHVLTLTEGQMGTRMTTQPHASAHAGPYGGGWVSHGPDTGGRALSRPGEDSQHPRGRQAWQGRPPGRWAQGRVAHPTGSGSGGGGGRAGRVRGASSRCHHPVPGQASSPSATATVRTVPSLCWCAGTAAGAGPPVCTWPPRLTPRPSLPTTGCR